MIRRRIAVATDGWGGLKDTVSNVFGRAKTFTIVEIHGGEIVNVDVLDNPALSYSHGAGPIAIKTLIDNGVDAVVANELGIGASEILQQHNVIYGRVEPGTIVEEVVKKAIQTHQW